MSTDARQSIDPRSDAALLRSSRAGHGDAFGVIYDRHASVALRLAGRMLNPAAAEDVVQESFLTLWRGAAYDAGHGSLRAYLLTIVHNRAIDRLRRDARSNRDSMVDAVLEHVGAPERTEEHVERDSVGQVLRDAVSGLPDAQRQAVEMRFIHGLTQVEISRVLGIPLGTVKSRMRLGLSRLSLDPQVLACR